MTRSSLALLLVLPLAARAAPRAAAEILPTGVHITPTAAAGAHFQRLDPGLAHRPGFAADHACSSALSPDGKTLLVVTSGYNLNNGPDGNVVVADSNEYVFVFDATRSPPVRQQVLQVPNTFCGLAWAPGGQRFYVTGGVDDDVHVFARQATRFAEVAPSIPLGHAPDRLLRLQPQAAGIAVTADGARALVANFEHDSATLIDLATRATTEIALRPGRIDPAQHGKAGGEFPFWVVIKGDGKAYVSSERDGEVVVIDLHRATPAVSGRIKVGEQPNKMILDRAQKRLFVANASSDSVSIIDTASDRVIETVRAVAPPELLGESNGLRGANSNALALSTDERTLFVSNGGTNSVAVIALAGKERGDGDGDRDEREEREGRRARVVGLIPTGWYPTAVSVAGGKLIVANAKSNAGPNPDNCRNTPSIAPGSDAACSASNEYVWQLEKAGLLSLPIPRGEELAELTWQVARNNRFPAAGEERHRRELTEFLGRHVKHVVYVIKENRTYDQILGDLDRGNGDPALVVFPEAITPNHHALARAFVTLDNFYDSGETSGVGWNWTTAGRTTDLIEKTQPVNYAGRGLTYDWEGTNRNVNVGLATVAERQAAMPLTPSDPDLLPGAKDVSSELNGEGATAYLWDNALRHGRTVRNYGCFGDLARYFLPPTLPAYVPPDRTPFAHGKRQFWPTAVGLQHVSDLFYRGYDNNFPDFWRIKEWEREFDQLEASGELPALSLVRLPHDHFGSFASAIDGVNTPDTQMADNDYAVGKLVERISKSRFANDTLIFVIEDDAQDGPDHVDAHRSIAYVIGPYVKQGAVVSRHYTTVNMVRTIEDVLGLPAQGLTDGLAAPMSEVFERTLRPWGYQARVPDVLRSTALPLPAGHAAAPRGNAAFWEKAMAGQRFDREDALDAARFNRALWKGLKGAGVPYPSERNRSDLSKDRARLLSRASAQR